MSGDAEQRGARVSGLWAFLAVLLFLMFVVDGTPVDPYAPVQPWPIELPECGA